MLSALLTFVYYIRELDYFTAFIFIICSTFYYVIRTRSVQCGLVQVRKLDTVIAVSLARDFILSLFFEFRSLKTMKFIAPQCAITTREDYTVLKTIRHSLKLAVRDLRRDLDPYRRGFYEERTRTWATVRSVDVSPPRLVSRCKSSA